MEIRKKQVITSASHQGKYKPLRILVLILIWNVTDVLSRGVSWSDIHLERSALDDMWIKYIKIWNQKEKPVRRLLALNLKEEFSLWALFLPFS